jgi:phage terminase small subunit
MNPPPHFTPSQAKEFKAIVSRLKRARLLAKADPILIRGLAIASAEAQSAADFLARNGRTFCTPGRAYRCPVCRGSGLNSARKGKECRPCRGRGVILGGGFVHQYPEASLLTGAIDAIARLTSLLGLAPNAIQVGKKR